MSQRESGYERIELDCYETPEWVTRVLLPYLSSIKFVWEPAAGSGKMARELKAAGLQVLSTDISTGQDFLLAGAQSVDAIVTNPPYISATRFIEHALRLMSGAAKWRCCSARTLTTPGVGTYFRNVPHSPARSSSQNVSGGSKIPPANHPSITHGTFGIISTLASQPLNTICSIEEAMRVEAGLFTRSA